jgi:hypothetical protein
MQSSRLLSDIQWFTGRANGATCEELGWREYLSQVFCVVTDQVGPTDHTAHDGGDVHYTPQGSQTLAKQVEEAISEALKK